MAFWKWFSKKDLHKEYLKELYSNPDNLVEIEFYNRTAQPKTLWVELACEEITLDAGNEFKIVTHDRFLRFEYSENFITLYLQYSFGFKLYSKKHSKDINNPFDWELIYDISHIN